jgi:hypothetical protein
VVDWSNRVDFFPDTGGEDSLLQQIQLGNDAFMSRLQALVKKDVSASAAMSSTPSAWSVSMERSLIDTNILIYNNETFDPPKQQLAHDLFIEPGQPHMRDRPMPHLLEICAPIVSVEPTLHGERHVHVCSPIWLWPSATGPSCSRPISNWLERLKAPAAEAEGSRARDRHCSGPKLRPTCCPHTPGWLKSDHLPPGP